MSGTHKEIFPNFLLNSEMAVDTDLRKHFPDSLNGEQVFDHELSSLYTPLASDHGFLSIQVLEFKTSLLEAAEELHIHRDAEMRFEEQINKFVMEKQELEWEKESLQHQIDTLGQQHKESLAAQKKQFHARIAEIEGEKGKHQLCAELKDREIVRLKEEMKMLQLFKYSLQKKLSELEQKLQLQAQTKDSHLSQLGEVERRFGALSRQTATVKQAHEKLVQNVEEALRLNKKLTIVNGQQEATINSLKQDVDKANSKVIKSKVSSACKSGEDTSLQIIKEQQMQQLNLRLNMETEMNKQLMKENAVVMAEKQGVMSSLWQAQQLLQAQTEALSRVEQELSVQGEERQALKREHKLFQEKIGEKEGQIDSLTEDHNRTAAEWKNEEKILQEKLTAVQEELRSVKEAYGFIHEKYQGLSLRMDHAQKGEGDSMQLEENSGNPETRGDEQRGGASDGPKGNASLQGHADPVQPQVSAERAPPNRDGIGVDGQEPDKSSDAGPGEPEETASDKGPQADHRQTAAVLLPQPGSPRSPACFPAAGATAADGADALAVSAVVAGRERSPGQLHSREPDYGFPPSGDARQGAGLDSEPGEPERSSVHDADCDPAGGEREGGKREETGRIQKTATHTPDERGGGSQESAGPERAGSAESAALQAELNGRPGLPEASHTGAPPNPTEQQDGFSRLTSGACRADSDVDPFSPPEGALASDDGTTAEKDEPRLTPPQLVISRPHDPASTPADSYGSRPHDPASTPADSYGSRPHDPASTPADSYGSRPHDPASTPADSYGSRPHDPASTPADSYGSRPHDLASTPADSYGSRPHDPASTPADSYGSRPHDPASTPADSYGSRPHDPASTPADSCGSRPHDPASTPADSCGSRPHDPASTPADSYGSRPHNPASTPADTYGSRPHDPAPTPADSYGERKEAKESDEHEDLKAAAGDVSATNEERGHGGSSARDVDPSAKPDASSGSALASPCHPDVPHGRGPELKPSRSWTDVSEPKSADRAGERLDALRGFEPREENAPNEERSSLRQLPETADPPETLDGESAPPGSPGGCDGDEGAWPSGETAGETGDARPPVHKRFRSSFQLELLMRARASPAPCGYLAFARRPPKGDHATGLVSRSLTPSIPSFLKPSQLRPAFQGFLPPLTISTPQTYRPISGGSPAIRRAADASNASSVYPPRQKRDAREEWNAIARTFGETPSGPENDQTQRVHVPSGPAWSDFLAPSSASVGTPPAGTPSWRPSPPDHDTELVAPGPLSEGNEQSKISARISETGRLHLPQKRKVEAEGLEVHTTER